MNPGEARKQIGLGDGAAQVTFHQVPRRALEGQITGMAGADPGGLDRRAGVAVEAVEPAVRFLVVPGLAPGRLAVVRGEIDLRLGARQEGGIALRGFGVFAAGGDAEPDAAQRRAGAIGFAGPVKSL